MKHCPCGFNYLLLKNQTNTNTKIIEPRDRNTVVIHLNWLNTCIIREIKALEPANEAISPTNFFDLVLEDHEIVCGNYCVSIYSSTIYLGNKLWHAEIVVTQKSKIIFFVINVLRKTWLRAANAARVLYMKMSSSPIPC